MRRAFKFRLFTNANQSASLTSPWRRIVGSTTPAWTIGNSPTTQHGVDAELRRLLRVVQAPTGDESLLRPDQLQARPGDDAAARQGVRRRSSAASRPERNPAIPRFKGRDRFDSIEFPAYGDGIRLIGGKLRVQHVGMIRVKLHRPIEGKIKTVTLKREAGKWYVVFSCDLGDVAVEPSTNPPSGSTWGWSPS